MPLHFSLTYLEAESVSITLNLKKQSRDNESCNCHGAANPGSSDSEESLPSNQHRNKPQVGEMSRNGCSSDWLVTSDSGCWTPLAAPPSAWCGPGVTWPGITRMTNCTAGIILHSTTGSDQPTDLQISTLICQVNRGRCGICGDPWAGAHPHQAGGLWVARFTGTFNFIAILRYASGTIAKSYKVGQVMEVVISVLAETAVRSDSA